MSQVKLAVIGPGLIGKTHIQLVREHVGCSLAALVAPDKPKHH